MFSMQTVSLPESRGKAMGYDYDMESMRNGHGQMTFHGNENSRKTRKNGRNMGYSMI